MQRSLSTSKLLDYAVKSVLVILALAMVFFIYTVIRVNYEERNSTPAARAVKNLEGAVRKDPNNITARLRLADALSAAGRIREAAEQYNTVLTQSEDEPGALAGLAHIAMNEGEWRTAEGYWRRIVETLSSGQYANVDQRLEKAYYYLGSCLMEVKEYEEATTYLKEALRMRKDASDTYFLMAIAYREMGSKDKYKQNLQNALQFDPLLAEANYELGKVLLEEGDTASAAEKFRVSADNAPAERREPHDALAALGTAGEHLAKAQAAVKKGDAETALSEARIAQALDPDDVTSARIVAQMFEKQKMTVQARAAWERVLTLAPGDEEAITASKRLGGAPK